MRAIREERAGRARLWPWLPLLAATLCSYGPVGNNYGFALYFLNWRHGFVKRGLVGELFAGVRFMDRWTLLGIELLFLAAAYALTYVVFRRLLFDDGEVGLVAAMLLAAPAGLPHLGYLFAQPDVSLYLIVLLSVSCWLRLPGRYAVWPVAGLCCVAMLAHEAYLLMFYPLMVAIMWRKCRRGDLPWWMAATAAMIVAMAWVLIVHFGRLPVSADVVLAEALARTDVSVQRQVYDVMASTLSGQFALVRKMYSPPVVRVLCVTLVLCAPYFWLLWRVARVLLKAERARTVDRAVFGLLLSCPMMLCALGHDTTRWIGAACMDLSLYVLYVLLDEGEGAARAAVVQWARGTSVPAWIVYLLVIGPMGATGVRAAEQMDVLWQMR